MATGVGQLGSDQSKPLMDRRTHFQIVWLRALELRNAAEFFPLTNTQTQPRSFGRGACVAVDAFGSSYSSNPRLPFAAAVQSINFAATRMSGVGTKQAFGRAHDSSSNHALQREI